MIENILLFLLYNLHFAFYILPLLKFRSLFKLVLPTNAVGPTISKYISDRMSGKKIDI